MFLSKIDSSEEGTVTSLSVELFLGFAVAASIGFFEMLFVLYYYHQTYTSYFLRP